MNTRSIHEYRRPAIEGIAQLELEIRQEMIMHPRPAWFLMEITQKYIELVRHRRDAILSTQKHRAEAVVASRRFFQGHSFTAAGPFPPSFSAMAADRSDWAPDIFPGASPN